MSRSATRIEEEHGAPVSGGRLCKTIRHGDEGFDDGDFWDEFAASIVEPDKHRPQVRMVVPRELYTVGLRNDGKYHVIPTDKNDPTRQPFFNTETKRQFTRALSTTYANPKKNYRPPFFSWYGIQNSPVEVGVSFPATSARVHAIICRNVSTYDRHLDQSTKQKAEGHIEDGLYTQTMFETLAELEEAKHYYKEGNEVLAYLPQWDVECGADGSEDQRPHITIFTSTSQSFLLAQLRAIDLKQRLQAAHPGVTITVPISFYPNFEIYTEAEHAQDRDDAKQSTSPTLHNYLRAIVFLEKSEPDSDRLFDSIDEIHTLLNKTNPQLAQQYANAMPDCAEKFFDDQALESKPPRDTIEKYKFCEYPLLYALHADITNIEDKLSVLDQTDSAKKLFFTKARIVKLLVDYINSNIPAEQPYNGQLEENFRLKKSAFTLFGTGDLTRQRVRNAHDRIHDILKAGDLNSIYSFVDSSVRFNNTATPGLFKTHNDYNTTLAQCTADSQLRFQR